MNTLNLITRKLSNVDFLFNALKVAFLSLIIIGLACVVYQVVTSPESITFGSF